MATTRKTQPGRKSRRQKQPATIDLKANPPEEAETVEDVAEAEASEAAVSAEASSVFAEEAVKDDMPSEGGGDAEGDDGDPEAAVTPEGGEIPAETSREEKRGGVGGLIQAAVAAVVGGGIALGGANLMGQLGASGLPEGADPAAISQSQEDIQALKAQLESLQQSVAGGASQDNEALSARVEALESAAGSGDGASISGEVEAAKSAADTALQRAQELETRLGELNAAILEGGGEGANGATTVLSGIEERLTALEAEAAGLSADLEARLAQMSEQASTSSDTEAAIEQNRQAIAGLKSEVEAVSAQINEKILPSMEQVEAAAEAAVSGQKIARSVSARALSNVLQQGGACSAELASAEALAGGAPEFERLRAIADKGIETQAQLLAGFDDVANRIVKVESRPDEDAGIVGRFMASAKSLVVVRPAGPVEGNSVGAILSRVEAALKSGNSGEALSQWETLPEEARRMGAEWEQALRQRIEAESLIGTVVEKLSAGQG